MCARVPPHGGKRGSSLRRILPSHSRSLAPPLDALSHTDRQKKEGGTGKEEELLFRNQHQSRVKVRREAGRERERARRVVSERASPPPAACALLFLPPPPLFVSQGFFEPKLDNLFLSVYLFCGENPTLFFSLSSIAFACCPIPK